MQPIQELLNRIQWDKDFGTGKFEIGYYDRLEEKIIRVPLRELYFDQKDHFSFMLLDAEGELHTIPYHRIKGVYKDGELIWHRTQ